MNRLIRAELYRVSHSSKMILWLVGITFFMVIRVFLDNFLQGYDWKTMSGEIYLLGIYNLMYFIFVTIFCLAGYFGGTGYSQNLYYHEIMHGNKIHSILLSKVLVSTAVIVGVTVVIYGLGYLFCGLKCGFTWSDGGFYFCDYEFFLIMATVLLQVVISSILMSISFKGLVGIAVAFVRWELLEGLAVILLGYLRHTGISKDVYSKLYYSFVFNRLDVVGNNFDKPMDTIIFVGFIVMAIEIAFWYILAYYTYKKKMFH